MTQDRHSASTSATASALHGIRVIDFGQYIAGPLVGMPLADQDAEVITVERPQGDLARAQAVCHLGKFHTLADFRDDPSVCQADVRQFPTEYHEAPSWLHVLGRTGFHGRER